MNVVCRDLVNLVSSNRVWLCLSNKARDSAASGGWRREERLERSDGEREREERQRERGEVGERQRERGEVGERQRGVREREERQRKREERGAMEREAGGRNHYAVALLTKAYWFNYFLDVLMKCFAHKKQ